MKAEADANANTDKEVQGSAQTLLDFVQQAKMPLASVSSGYHGTGFLFCTCYLFANVHKMVSLHILNSYNRSTIHA